MSKPFTIEHVNTLLGSRQHRKATEYFDQGAAEARALEESLRVRPFVLINVLDARGKAVASFQGGAPK